MLFCKAWISRRPMQSVSRPTENPRAWIAVRAILYLDGEGAYFSEVRDEVV